MGQYPIRASNAKRKATHRCVFGYTGGKQTLKGVTTFARGETGTQYISPQCQLLDHAWKRASETETIYYAFFKGFRPLICTSETDLKVISGPLERRHLELEGKSIL